MMNATREGAPGNTGRYAFTLQDLKQAITDRFGFVASSQPHATAVRTDEATHTYENLRSGALWLAGGLARLEKPRRSVALLFPHGASIAPAVFGALFAGMPYVPLDPRHPTARLSYICQDAECSAVVASPEMAELARAVSGSGVQVLVLPDRPDRAGDMLLPRVSPDDTAYILYTSGTTGRPKGIAQNHGNVLHHCRVYANSIGIGPSDRLTLLTSYGFDGAVMDFFGALLNGATLLPADIRRVPHRSMLRWVAEEGVTVLHATPSVFRYLCETIPDEGGFRNIRVVVLGGEMATRRDVEIFRRVFGPACTLVNGYGPTESTTAAQYFLHSDSFAPDPLPIGSPVEGCEIDLLGEDLQPVPRGSIGQIAIRGRYLAPGYWRMPELTSERFPAALQRDGLRVYLTGDLGRLGDHGLEFRGREDDQVKVRGHRVELREIEAAILGCQGVQQCVARPDPACTSGTRLLAFVTPETLNTEDIRATLAELLPEYMIPARIESRSELPLSPNGKVDVAALIGEQNVYVARSDSPAALPGSDIKERLTQLLAEALEVPRAAIPPGSTFFSVGGDSLAAMRLIRSLNQHYGIVLTLRQIFEKPSIAAWADLIERAR